MKGKDRRYHEPRCCIHSIASILPTVSGIAPAVCIAGGRAGRELLKAGHAFYVVDGNNLLVRGVPTRNAYSQSSAGLP